jgi:ABC-type antimicrobial peptide transport system permease subunit
MTKPVAVAIARVDKDLALTEIQTLEEIANQSVGRPRFRAVLAAAFALAALTLAVIGVYGVLAFGVSQRLKEFGIRLALGATSTTLLRLVLRDGLRIAAVGLASGMAAAGMLSRLLARFLFDVKPLDPLTFIGVPVLLGLVTLLACLIPARRAMAVDPMTALRDE